MSKTPRFSKGHKIGLAAVFILAALLTLFYLQYKPHKDIQWGVNFSITQAGYLGFDWKKMYLDILNDLKPKRLRIMGYWEILEPQKGRFNFEDFDFVLKEADKRNIKVILVLGHKQPRWPECHHPSWYENLSKIEADASLLLMLQKSIYHFKNFNSIQAWQIENEPFFPFGPKCFGIPKAFYKQELAMVKSLDNRPIIVTDSGEKGAWLLTAWAGGDIFGSTMYREIYHHKKQKYIKYPIPAALYRIKAGVVKTFSNIDQFVGVELQAEQWFATDVYRTDFARQNELMNPEIFSEYVAYARKVGFAENYFWGVEWWYWAKQHGHKEMWEAAKKLMTNP